jgi:5S rRNA maturation endonuclease (ribonuclease M5)
VEKWAASERAVRGLLFTCEKANLESGSSLTRIKPEAIYSYRDEAANLLYQVLRCPGKAFRQRHPDADGGWVYNLEGVHRVLYHLADVITATHIIMVEGEKDVERVTKARAYFESWQLVRGRAVTTCSGGAAGWRAEYAPYFVGKSVYILPDNDEPGRKFARTVAQDVSTYARRLKIVNLPGLPMGEDYGMGRNKQRRKLGTRCLYYCTTSVNFAVCVRVVEPEVKMPETVMV